MFLAIILLVCGIGSSVASADSRHRHIFQSDLARYLSIVKSVYPAAAVTGRFYDWRTISKYRERAGFHFGYDIAMPTGTAVPAGWSGTVTAVNVWYGAEHGITVRSTSGSEVTYGHLIPLVRTGDSVAAGEALGTVAIDHVDIKMRDPLGNYVDFGTGLDALPEKVGTFRSLWLSSEARLLQVEESISGQKARAEELRRTLPLLLSQYEEGIIPRNRVGETRSELESLDRSSALAREERDILLKQVVSWRKEFGPPPKKQTSQNHAPRDTAERRKLREKLDRLEELYQEGIIARKEVEEAREAYRQATSPR
ncbi:MAG: peptidoglycan DD-metalloendopeptidase family protein [Armatimonadetes bacterium]|nr:peptidoglycan DD-metalloendopeptidase family protein [Armatimonadota bacterium]